jgi:hypothetical protein
MYSRAIWRPMFRTIAITCSRPRRSASRRWYWPIRCSFAIKAAIRASRLERGLAGLFLFDAPATVQEVRRACELAPDRDAPPAA